jgi:hypothetical protein
MRQRLRAPVLGAAMALAALGPAHAVSAADATAGQVAISMSGVFAQTGIYDAHFADGSTRFFTALLVTPGVATASPASGSLDIGRQWAVLTEWMSSDPASGYQRDGQMLCSTATNPSTATSSADSAGTWNGASVDLRCDDGAGYAFYRVQWSASPSSVLVTNPVTALWMGGEETRWSANGLNGMVNLWPTAAEITTASVCGYRAGTPTEPGHFDCFGGRHGDGYVVPSTNLMFTEYAPSAAG